MIHPMMAKDKSVGDELEWMRKKYSNAIRFKTEQKPINNRFYFDTPKLDLRCNLFLGIFDTHNMGKVHPKKISYMRECRKAIKEHHEKMKDDPERLTTNFLIKLTGCNCEMMKN
jgi:hypothetical protein